MTDFQLLTPGTARASANMLHLHGSPGQLVSGTVKYEMSFSPCEMTDSLAETSFADLLIQLSTHYTLFLVHTM